MRTNIEIDEKAIRGVMRAYGFTTKREAVDAALQTMLRLKAQTSISKLRGKVQWEGDLEESRSSKYAA